MTTSQGTVELVTVDPTNGARVVDEGTFLALLVSVSPRSGAHIALGAQAFARAAGLLLGTRRAIISHEPL